MPHGWVRLFSGMCLTRTNVSTRLITKSENKQLGTALPALPGSESVGGAGKEDGAAGLGMAQRLLSVSSLQIG